MNDTDPVSGPGVAGTASHNLLLRIASALVMAPIAIAAAYYNGWSFVLFWGVAAVTVLWEWTVLVAGNGQRLLVSAGGSAIAIAALVDRLHHPIVAVLLVGLGAFATAIFAARERRGWIIAGTGYAGMMLLAPVVLRDDADPYYGFLAIILLFAVVWTTDIFAYFAGRAIGGPKLWPAVSPKKTWSGAIAGTLGAMLAGIVVARLSAGLSESAVALVSILLSILSQLGDLLESFIKRRFGAKDASHLIPGHGGAMDRLDGFWAAAIAGCLIGLIRGGFDAPARGLLLW